MNNKLKITFLGGVGEIGKNMTAFEYNNEIIVVDDLKPGYDMARSAGADFAAAGWAYDVPEIAEFMKKNCDCYLRSTAELYELLFK